MTGKQIGYVFLAVGFLAGTYFAMRQADFVEWPYFIACAAVMFVGLVLVRAAASAEKDDKETHDVSIEILHKSLDKVVTDIGVILGEKETLDVYAVHGRIDADLMSDLSDFVDARESMIPLFGLQKYADVMSEFANGERNLNRAWSASADGYIDEVWASVARAYARMKEAKKLLTEAAAAAV